MLSIVKALIQSMYVTPSAGLYDETQHTFITKPWHIDYNIHVNNAVYLKYFEDGRWAHSIVTGTLKKCIKYKYNFVVASIEVGYFREIGPFKKMTTKTQIVGCDEKYAYFSQSIFDQKGKLYTNAMIKAALIHKGKSASAGEAMAQMGYPAPPTPLPAHFETWRQVFKEKREYTDRHS